MCFLSSNKRFSLFSEALHNKWFVEFISIRKIIISCSWIIQLLFSHQCVKKTRGCHCIRSSQHNVGRNIITISTEINKYKNGSINSIFNSDYFVFCLFFGKLITLKIWVEGGRERVCNLNKKEKKMCLERQNYCQPLSSQWKPDEVTTEDAEGRNIFAVFTCSSHIISFPFCNVTVVMNIVALLLYALNDL